MKLICPQCGTSYEKGKFCLECGTPLEEVQVKKVLYCPNCQMEIPSGKFCPECGTKLEEREVVLSDMPEILQTEETIPVDEVVSNVADDSEDILAKYRDEYGDMRNLNQEEYVIAVEELQACADKGNAEAMCFIALLYFDGTGVEKNPSKAYEMLIKAEELGSEFAKAILGIFYLQGIVIEQNVDEGLKRLVNGYKVLGIPSLAGGLAIYYYMLGDYKNALKFAQEAADKNDNKGLTTLGALYLNGNGIEKNNEKAFECYMQAAAMGDATAFNQLGIMYKNGCGVNEDPQQAYFWWNEAAQKEDEVGLYNLACCYLNGYGTERDVEKAAEWFKKSAEAGCVNAMLELAGYYQSIFIDNEKAKKWLSTAAEQGNAEAMNQLGVFYADVEENHKEAIKWYKKAIELGQPDAYRNLALCYRDGTGIKQDEKKAQELLAKAAELGVNDANEISEDITANNEDNRINEANEKFNNGQEKEAVAIYKELADKGNLRALGNYANCLINGWGVKQDFKQGIELMKTAADSSYGWACCRMVEIYAGTDYNGKSIAQIDVVNAKKYLDLAKKNKVDSKTIAELSSLITPSASIANVKIDSNIVHIDKVGITVKAHLNVSGLKGESIRVSAYRIYEFEDESKIVYNEDGDDWGLVYTQKLTPKYTETEWQDYMFFVSYESIYIDHVFDNEKLSIVVWNISEEKPAILAKVDIPFSISCEKHLLRSDEYFFAVKK